MIITTNCWLNQGWIDNKLSWDPKLFNNIKTVHIPAEKIWRPDILLGTCRILFDSIFYSFF